MIRNVEIKARCQDPGPIRTYLSSQNADFIGTDNQRDTYFNVPAGRMKLRQGSIENALIHYRRNDQKGPKTSEVSLFPVTDGDKLASLLQAALGVRVVVDKVREIYFIGHVKFHIDSVQGLGSFIEIEAIDDTDQKSLDELRADCEYYIKAFGISVSDLLTHSYSDMVAEVPKG
jgi:predicted adenylyl cyclase CyaB